MTILYIISALGLSLLFPTTAIFSTFAVIALQHDSFGILVFGVLFSLLIFFFFSHIYYKILKKLIKSLDDKGK